ncbi:hypothetical protein KKF86_07080 [bacterium]|nr:hypothetical protein [bacterium]
MNKISKSLLLIITIIVFGCDINKNISDIVISTYGSTKSHNVGKDCMACHINGGEAGFGFTIAGSVYDSNLNIPYPNVLITLFSDIEISDTPIEVIEVDGKGNFYSNIPIDWQNGLFASVSSDTEIRNMNAPIFDGSCNSCHGLTSAYINVE